MKELQILHIEHWSNFLPRLYPTFFIAIDVVGILPIFYVIGGWDRKKKHRKQKIVNQSVITGASVSNGFRAIGKFVFSVLGLRYMILKWLGGLLLLVFAINDLLFSEKGKRAVIKLWDLFP